jgi:hypothetical protein
MKYPCPGSSPTRNCWRRNGKVDKLIVAWDEALIIALAGIVVGGVERVVRGPTR